MSKKILRPLLSVAAIAVNFIPGIGQIASFAISTALTVGGSVLLKPKAPNISQANGQRLNVSPDLNAYRKIIFGSTAMATDLRYQAYTGSNQEYYHQILATSSHSADGIDEIWFDTEKAWSASGGVTAKYAGYLTVTPVLEGSANNTVSINGIWGHAQRLTGCSYVHLRYKLTGNSKKAESPFAQTVPSRVTIRGRGAKVYDPRFDSSRGGSGNQRVDDPTTWSFATMGIQSGRNPALQLLFYLLGWRVQNPVTGQRKLMVGRGFPANRIDIASFIAAANMCDEPVTKASGGTEPRYRSDGAFSEGDAPQTVTNALCAAMNGELRDNGGKISLAIMHNDLATPVAHFGMDDILGNESWKQTAPPNECVNIVRGNYVDPSDTALYQMVEYPDVALPSVDGIDRIDTFDLALVQSGSQSQRLAKSRLQRSQYQGLYSADFGARAWQVDLGSVVTLSHPTLGWNAKLFRVVGHGIRTDGVVPMVLQEEHVSIYSWEAEESPPVTAAVPTSYDYTKSPLFGGPPFDAVEIIYDTNETAQDLKPAEAGANVTQNHTSADTNAVAGRPSEQVTNQIDATASGLASTANVVAAVQQDVLDLEAVFGDTQSAQQYADAAADARDASLAAQAAVDAARADVDAAQAEVNLARSDAEAALEGALQAKTASEGAATASNANASIASAAADDAQDDAIAANQSKLDAQSASEDALSAATQTATNAATTTADRAATFADRNATAIFRDGALAGALETFPSTMDNAAWWTSQAGKGEPLRVALAPDGNRYFTEVEGEDIFETVHLPSYIGHRKMLPIVAGHTYRQRMIVWLANAGGGPVNQYMRVDLHTSRNGDVVNDFYSAIATPTVSDKWHIVESVFTAEQLWGIEPTATHVSSVALINAPARDGNVTRIKRFEFGDITAEANAELSATVARTESAAATAAASSALVSMEATASAATGAMSKNGRFLNYPSAAVGARPAHWDAYGAGTNASIRRTTGSPSGFSAQFDDMADHGIVGIVQTVDAAFKPGDWVAIDIEVELLAGSLSGLGPVTRFFNADTDDYLGGVDYSLPAQLDARGIAVGNGTAGRTYRISIPYQMAPNWPAARVETLLYFMVNGHFGAHIPKNIILRQCEMRPMTEAEIEQKTSHPAMKASISSQGAAIIDLQTGKASAVDLQAVQTNVAGISGTVSSQQAAISDLQANKANASAVQSVQAQVDSISGTVNSQQIAISDLETGKASAAALQEVKTQADGLSGTVSSQQSAINDLQTSKASAAALQEVKTQADGISGTVSSQQNAISDLQASKANASDVQSVQTQVAENTAKVSLQQESIDGIKGQWAIKVDVNGRISGIVNLNDGTVSNMDFLSDVFAFWTSQGRKRPFAIEDDKVTFGTDIYAGQHRIVFDNGSHMLVQGTGFGSANQFIEWFGPSRALNLCNEGSAISFRKINGDSYFGGALAAGTIRNSVQTTLSGADASVSTGLLTSLGHTRSIVLSYSLNERATYNGSSTLSGSPTATVVLERSFDGSAWTVLTTMNVTGGASLENGGYEGAPTRKDFEQGMSASTTVNDTGGGTTVHYRARLTSRTLATVSGGTLVEGSGVGQNISIVETET